MDDEVAHHSPIVGMHAWAKRVEDASHAHFHVALEKRKQGVMVKGGAFTEDITVYRGFSLMIILRASLPPP